MKVKLIIFKISLFLCLGVLSNLRLCAQEYYSQDLLDMPQTFNENIFNVLFGGKIQQSFELHSKDPNMESVNLKFIFLKTKGSPKDGGQNISLNFYEGSIGNLGRQIHSQVYSVESIDVETAFSVPDRAVMIRLDENLILNANQNYVFEISNSDQRDNLYFKFATVDYIEGESNKDSGDLWMKFYGLVTSTPVEEQLAVVNTPDSKYALDLLSSHFPIKMVNMFEAEPIKIESSLAGTLTYDIVDESKVRIERTSVNNGECEYLNLLGMEPGKTTVYVTDGQDTLSYFDVVVTERKLIDLTYTYIRYPGESDHDLQRCYQSVSENIKDIYKPYNIDISFSDNGIIEQEWDTNGNEVSDRDEAEHILSLAPNAENYFSNLVVLRQNKDDQYFGGSNGGGSSVGFGSDANLPRFGYVAVHLHRTPESIASTLAHELAHNLGLSHYSSANRNGVDVENQFQNIMKVGRQADEIYAFQWEVIHECINRRISLGEEYGNREEALINNFDNASIQSSFYQMEAMTNSDSEIKYLVTSGEDIVTSFNDGILEFSGSGQVEITAYVAATNSFLSNHKTITLELQYVPSQRENVDVRVCIGATYTFRDGSSYVVLEGAYRHESYLREEGGNGADLIVEENVIGLEQEDRVSYESHQDVCEGREVVFTDGTIVANIQEDMVHVSRMPSEYEGGCDILYEEHITVLKGLIIEENLSKSVCPGQSVTLENGIIIDNIQEDVHRTIRVEDSGEFACERIQHYHIEVFEAGVEEANVEKCFGESFTYRDGTVSENIIQDENHRSILETSHNGLCERVVVENIHILQEEHEENDISVCSGDGYTYRDGTTSENILESESHTSRLYGEGFNGCDLLVTENVEVLEIPMEYRFEDVCYGSIYTYLDGTESGRIFGDVSYTSRLEGSGSNGCDLLVTENVRVVAIADETVDVEICSGETYTYRDGTTSENIRANERHISYLEEDESGCEFTVTENIRVLAISNEIREVDICMGESYTYLDGTKIERILVSESHTSQLVGEGANGCDLFVIESLNALSISTERRDIDICSGNVYTYLDGTESGVVTANVSHTSRLVGEGVNGCDLLVTEKLHVLLPTYSTRVVEICSGDSYIYEDGTVSENITEAEVHTSRILDQAVVGCDLLLTENIVVLAIPSETIRVDVCLGESYTYLDGTVSDNIIEAEAHTSRLAGQGFNGCDLLITENIVVLTIPSETRDVNICSGESYTYLDGTVSENIIEKEVHTSRLLGQGFNGCDLLVTENVSVSGENFQTVRVQVCEGDSFTYQDGTESIGVIENESHTSRLAGAGENGCDLVITQEIIVVETEAQTATIQICSGDSYTYRDGSESLNITEDESYTSRLTGFGIAGCDLLVTENIVVVNPYLETRRVNICLGASYTYLDGTLSENIIATETHTSRIPGLGFNACDQIITEELNVLEVTSETRRVDICLGDSYTYLDGTVSENIIEEEAHTSKVSGQGLNACDQMITEDVFVSELASETRNVDVCKGDSYTYIDGTVSDNIMEAEEHTSVLSGEGSNGCDLLVTENLNINEVDNTVISEGVTLTVDLEGASYQWLDCYKNNLEIADATEQSFIGVAGGSYAVDITYNGCVIRSNCYSIIATGIFEPEESKKEVRMYPNPNSGLVHLNFGEYLSNVKITVRTVEGKVIKQLASISGNETSFRINAKAGIYFVEIITERDKKVLKLMKI